MAYKNFSLAALITAFMTQAAFCADQTSEQALENLPSIVVTTAQKRVLVDRIIATGTIQPVEEVFVQPQVEGLSIKDLAADVGDRIEAGATLAVLSNDALLLQKSQLQATRAKGEAMLAQFRAQLQEAQATALETSSQQSRVSELSKRGTVSTAQLEQAVAASSTAQARVKSAEQAVAVAQADLKVVASQIADVDLKLMRTEVASPVSGTISAKSARVGAIASAAGEPLFRIIKNGELELVAEVGESDILRIKAGQKAMISLTGGTTEPLSGTVRLVAPSIDPVTRLGLVHISLDDNNKARAGMYGSAEITIKTSQNVTLPLTAVLTSSTGAAARKVENGIVTSVDVQTGIQDGDFIEITEGLQVNEEVVAKAGAYVQDGDRIKAVLETESTSPEGINPK